MKREWEARWQVARSLVAIAAACEIKIGGESMPQILAASHDHGDEDGASLYPAEMSPMKVRARYV